MRPPSLAIVVDSAVLVTALLGRRGSVLAQVARTSRLAVTTRSVQEVRRRIELGMKRPDLLPLLDLLCDELTIIGAAAYEAAEPQAGIALADAVASRNGSGRNAHVLALAWSLDADIWSTDRDFAGTGVATWSTPNLIRALPDAP